MNDREGIAVEEGLQAFRDRETAIDDTVWSVVRDAIRSGTPFASLRLSDMEINPLYFDDVSPQYATHRALPSAPSATFTGLLVEAYSSADIVGLPPTRIMRKKPDISLDAIDFATDRTSRWPWHMMARAALCKHGINPPHFASWVSAASWITRHRFLAELADKRVVVVGLCAHALAMLWKEPCWLSYYQKFGASESTTITAAILTHEAHSADYMDVLESELDRADYDVLLVATGSAGKVLCSRAKAAGKVGIDCGMVLNALCGTGNPERAHINYDFDHRHPTYHPTPTSASRSWANSRLAHYEMRERVKNDA